MKIHPIPNHSTLPDMPSSTNTDHDGRYPTRAEWLQNGFPDVSEFTIGWTDGTRTLDITPVGASFNYYIEGVKYTRTTVLTIVIGTGVAGDNGLWVIYIDSEDTLASIQNPSEAQIDGLMENDCLVAYVYWNNTLSDGRLMCERHGYKMNPATHHWIHDNIGSVYKSGMALADFSDVDGDGDQDRDVQFSVASGEFYDEDLEIDTIAIAVGGNFEIWYLVSSVWTWATDDMPGLAAAGGSNRLAFNDSGSQTEVANTKFSLSHVFATSITDDAGDNPKYIIIQGQAQYDTKNLARAGAETEINNLVFGTLPLQEIVPVATIILQTNNNYDNDLKSRIVSTTAGDNYVDWRGSNIKASGGSIADHGALGGLTDDDHTQYILHSLADAANDFLVASAANTFVKKTLAETGAILEDDIDHGNIQGLDTGADHSYIDQDVKIAASPTFANMNMPANGKLNGEGSGGTSYITNTGSAWEIYQDGTKVATFSVV